MRQELKALAEIGLPEPPTEGNCYDTAFDYVMRHHGEDPTLRLVHAVVLTAAGPYEGLPHGHAWVERTQILTIPDDAPEAFKNFPDTALVWAIDKANGHDVEIPVAMYYGIGRVSQIHRYTYEEMTRWVVETGHYGHWELEVDR